MQQFVEARSGSAQEVCSPAGNHERMTSVGLRRNSKIRVEHWRKLAVVYVQQVEENRESTERQYALAGFAQELGCDDRGEIGLFGRNRMTQSVREHPNLSAKEILNHLCHDVRRFANGAPQKDDVTAVIIKVL